MLSLNFIYSNMRRSYSLMVTILSIGSLYETTFYCIYTKSIHCLTYTLTLNSIKESHNFKTPICTYIIVPLKCYLGQTIVIHIYQFILKMHHIYMLSYLEFQLIFPSFERSDFLILTPTQYPIALNTISFLVSEFTQLHTPNP